MRIEFSEAECSNCFHCRTQESEPSNVPVEALGHDDVGSTSTTPPVIASSVNSEPSRAPFQAAFGSTSSPLHSSSPCFGSNVFGSMQAPTFGASASAPAFAAPCPSLFGPMQTPAARFGFVPPVTSVSSASTAFGSGAFARPPPVQGSAPSMSTSFSFRPEPFASADVDRSPAINTPSATVVFGTTPVSVSSPFGPTQDFPNKSNSTFAASSFPNNSFSSFLPGYGVGYLPGTSSSLGGPPAFRGGLFSSGFNAPLPSSSSWSSATLSSNPNTGFGSQLFASHDRSRGTPVVDSLSGENVNMTSISASEPYLHKSHEEVRWEAYQKRGNGSFVSPIGSRPNAFFPQWTTQGNMSVSSSPASGCTACGATSSSSATFPIMFGATPSLPLMFAHVTTPSPQAYPMMFGTTNLAVQGATPVLQAYHVQTFIVPSFAAMNLH